MKIYIFSDIHGNYEALTKMFKAEKGADYFIFVGDIFGYFYGQKDILDLFLSKNNLLAVKGNHDQKFCDNIDRNIDEILIQKYGRSHYQKLPQYQIEYLKSIPKYLNVTLQGVSFGVFHGGPENYLNQRIYPNTPINVNLPECRCDYLILGHTHYRFLRLEKQLHIINPGSLGQPRDGKGFSYCVLDLPSGICSFKIVDVNIAHLIKEVENKDKNSELYKYLCNKYGEKI